MVLAHHGPMGFPISYVLLFIILPAKVILNSFKWVVNLILITTNLISCLYSSLTLARVKMVALRQARGLSLVVKV